MTDAGLLQHTALQEELPVRAVSPVRKYLERIEQPEASLEPEPEGVEALLDDPGRQQEQPLEIRQQGSSTIRMTFAGQGITVSISTRSLIDRASNTL